MILERLTGFDNPVYQHEHEISDLMEEANLQSGQISDFQGAATIVKKGQLIIAPSDFTENNTNNPRNPHFDWVATKTFTHNLGYVPLAYVYEGSSAWTDYPAGVQLYWTLPHTVFWDGGQPTYYQYKPRTYIYYTIDTSTLTVIYKTNFFAPTDTAYIYFALLDQAMNI